MFPMSSLENFLHKLEKLLDEFEEKLHKLEKCCCTSPKNSCTSWKKLFDEFEKKYIACKSWKNIVARVGKNLARVGKKRSTSPKKSCTSWKNIVDELDKIVGRVRKKLHELVGKNSETCLSLQVNSTRWRLKVSELRRHFNFGTWS